MHLTTTLKMIQPVKAEKFGRTDNGDMYYGAKQVKQKLHTRQMRGQGKDAVRKGLMDIDLNKVLDKIEAEEKVAAETRAKLEAVGNKIDEARQAFMDLIREARNMVSDLPAEAREEAYERFWWPTLE